MASLSVAIFDTVRQSLTLQITFTLCALLSVGRIIPSQAVRYLLICVCTGQYPIGQGAYNLLFHPLSKFPGPKLWAASRLPFVYCLLTGKLVQRERELHEKYGGIVRLAPDEISFATEQAWNDIHTLRRGHKRTQRDRVYYFAPYNQADIFITTSDAKDHLRARTLLSNCFAEKALRAQHPLISGHADILVQKMRGAVTKHTGDKQGALVNMTDWLNFFTIDVMGDLAFGESFGCLTAGDYHSWVRTLFSYLKAMALGAAPRFYPTAEFLLEKFIPKSILEGQRQHTQYAYDKINHRLDTKSDRPDFVTPLMENNASYEIMSRDEILAAFNFIIIAGTETTATVLTGIFNHLTKNEHVMSTLCVEIRTAFKREKDITIDAIMGLEYLEAVINEGLRICNPLPAGLPRVVPEGGDSYAGVYLPGGTRVGVRTLAVNRSEDLFANPDRFVPERWLAKGERPREYDNDHLSASKPFSVGFHSCLGRSLAWVELRLVLIRLLWAFDFADELSERVYFDKFPVIMMVQKQPMKMRIKLRQGLDDVAHAS